MKRKGTVLLEEEESQLVKVIVQEINAPAGTQKAPEPEKAKVESDEIKDKKKKKKRKNKGIDAFLEDPSEAKAYQQLEKAEVQT